MKLLAGLDVTAKGVERTAETVGEDIGRRERAEIGKAVQLDLLGRGKADSGSVRGTRRNRGASGEERDPGPAG